MIRPVHTYTVPTSLRFEGGPIQIGLQPLTAEQEITASKVAGFNLLKSQYEAVKRAIVEFDGKGANFADGQVDEFWDKCSPKLRALLLGAYSKITSASEEEEAGFFGSEQIKVS